LPCSPHSELLARARFSGVAFLVLVHWSSWYKTVRHREIGTGRTGTILEFASVPLQKNRNSLAWVLPTLSVCPTSILTHVGSRSNLGLASRNCESQVTKNRGACALTRTGGSLCTIKLKSAWRKPAALSLAGLDPVPLSNIGTRLLASLDSKGKNRNSLTEAWLRNAGSYFTMTYCTQENLDQNSNQDLT